VTDERNNDRKLWLLDETRVEADIIEAVDTLVNEPRLALDLEADSFHHYSEQVCLVQIGSNDADVIYDPVTHGLHASLRALLTAPSRTWILHGGDYDVLMLKRDFSLELGRVFDTHVAARFLGYDGLGLQSLLERELGIRISKGEQRSDWRRRPLSPEQVRYARQDVEHLHPLADKLIEHLEKAGRLAWVEEECEILRRRAYIPKEPDPEAWAKLKGTKELPPIGLAVVRAVFSWRDRMARRQDRAPFRVLPNETIVAVAHHAAIKGPPSAQDLRGARGIGRGVDVAELATEIKAAVAAPPPPRARLQSQQAPQGPPKTRVEMLKKARHEWAATLGIDPALVLPPALIDVLAASQPASLESLDGVPGMTRWRYEAIGPSLWNVLRSG